MLFHYAGIDARKNQLKQRCTIELLSSKHINQIFKVKKLPELDAVIVKTMSVNCEFPVFSALKRFEYCQ